MSPAIVPFPARLPLPVITAGLALGLAACGGEAGSSTGPDGGSSGPPTTPPPGLTVLAGAGITDTIDAQPVQALKIVVRDAAGRPMPRVVVRFTSVIAPARTAPDGAALPSGATAYVGALTSAAVSTFVADSTAADGTLSVRVVLGHVAGPGGVAITVPDVGLADTAEFTVQPGAPTAIGLAPKDSAIALGASLSLSAAAKDRWGNRRTDALSYRSTDATLSASATGSVTAAVPTRAAVVVSVTGAPSVKPETTWVSAVPNGTIAVRRNGKLTVMRLDGTIAQTIPTTLDAGDPEWTLDGQALLTTLGSSGDAGSLYRIGMDSSAALLLYGGGASANNPAPLRGTIRSFAQTADGASLIVAMNDCNSDAVMYRVTPAPTITADRLSPLAPSAPASYADCFDTVQLWPSPSPDGTRVVFEHDSAYYNGFSIRLLDLATKRVTALKVVGQRPRWSPTGDLIAYYNANSIWVTRPDGSGQRMVSPPTRQYVAGVSWSPDGRWLLARFSPTQGYAGTTLALLDAQTGTEIPLTYTTGYGTYGLAAWRPTR